MQMRSVLIFLSWVLRDIIVSGDSVWVSRRDPGSVVRIEARTGQIVKSIAVGNGAQGLASTTGAVWVANENDSTVSKIDPATDSVTSAVKVGNGPTALAAAGDALWVANRMAGTLSRIDRDGQELRYHLNSADDPSLSEYSLANLEVNWVETVAPSALLTLLIVAFAFLGDGLRDAFDPQTKES